MTTTVHVVGYIWKDEGIFLQVRDNIAGPMRDYQLSGEIYLRKTGEIHCTGWIDFTQMALLPCPTQTPGKRQCASCIQREGFMPCVMCKKHNCPTLKPAVEAYCRQRHHLYLACFGDTSIKVGTASDARKYLRLLEQGPLAAAYVAEAPGPTIKQLEHSITQLGYVDAKRRADKRLLLTSKMSESRGKELIQTAIGAILPQLASSDRAYFHEAEYIHLPALSMAGRTFTHLKELNPPQLFVGGQVAAASGNMLILNQSGEVGTLDLTSLKGYWVEISETSDVPQAPSQLSLF